MILTKLARVLARVCLCVCVNTLVMSHLSLLFVTCHLSDALFFRLKSCSIVRKVRADGIINDSTKCQSFQGTRGAAYYHSFTDGRDNQS